MNQFIKIVCASCLLIICGCSSVRLIDSWTNEKVLFFKPRKMMVLGVTKNLTARKIFEENLKKEFIAHNINTYESAEILDQNFTDSKKTEDEINEMITGLTEEGFDAIMISAVKGVDDVKNYESGYYTVGYSWWGFRRYYYTYQDIYYNPGYYTNYKIYHIETSLYNINEDNDKSLIWVGAFDIVDPQTISTTVHEYVDAVMKQLRRDGIITKR